MTRTKDFIDKLMDYEEGQMKDPALMADMLYICAKNGYSMANISVSLEQVKSQEQLINKLVVEQSEL